MVKGVQRRATKMIPILGNSSYKERLKRLGMIDWSVQDDSRYWQGKSRNLGKLFCIDEDGKTRKVCLKIRSHVNSNIYWIFH